jgi:hypothetical protein
MDESVHADCVAVQAQRQRTAELRARRAWIDDLAARICAGFGCKPREPRPLPGAYIPKPLKEEQYDRAVLGRFRLWHQPDPNAPKRKRKNGRLEITIAETPREGWDRALFGWREFGWPAGTGTRTFALPPRRHLVPAFVGITRGVKEPERPVYLGDIRVAAVGKPFEVPLVRSSLPVVHSEPNWADRDRLAKIREDHTREWKAWIKSVSLQKPRLEWADEEETVHEVGEANGKPVKSRWHIQTESDLDAAFTREPDVTEQLDFGPVAKPGKLIMGRWTAPYVPQRPLEWCPAKWMLAFGWPPLPPPWPPIPFRTIHNPYVVTLKRLGFKLERGKPASTYVKYGRMKADGAVGAPIEDDDAWRLEAMTDAPPIEPDSEPTEIRVVDTGRFPHPSIPTDCAAWRQWWGRVWKIKVYMLGDGFVMFVGSFFWLEPAPVRKPLTRDMATRYAWQIPKDIPFSRTLARWRDDAWGLRRGRSVLLRRGIGEVPYPRGRKPGRTSEEGAAIRRAIGNRGVTLLMEGHTFRQACRTVEMEFSHTGYRYATAQRETNERYREFIESMVDAIMEWYRTLAAENGIEIDLGPGSKIELLVRDALFQLARSESRDKPYGAKFLAAMSFAVTKHLKGRIDAMIDGGPPYELTVRVPKK